MGGSNGELQELTNRLVDRAKACRMEVSIEKNKILTSITSNFSADISMNGQKLEEVTSLKSWSNLVRGWHLFGRNPHQYHLSSVQDLSQQHHQLRKQVHAV